MDFLGCYRRIKTKKQVAHPCVDDMNAIYFTYLIWVVWRHLAYQTNQNGDTHDYCAYNAVLSTFQIHVPIALFFMAWLQS